MNEGTYHADMKMIKQLLSYGSHRIALEYDAENEKKMYNWYNLRKKRIFQCTGEILFLRFIKCYWDTC